MLKCELPQCGRLEGLCGADARLELGSCEELEGDAKLTFATHLILRVPQRARLKSQMLCMFCTPKSVAKQPLAGNAFLPSLHAARCHGQ